MPVPLYLEGLILIKITSTMQFFVLIELPLVLDVFCYLYIFYYTFRSRTKEK